jgi:acetyl esterase/lipase
MGGAQAADAPKYEIVSDIPYPHDGTEYAQDRCKLDLYLPKDQQDFPVLVWFHGGYLEEGGGSKWTRPEAAQRFAAEGFGVVLPNYRGYPRATYPKFIEDAASVVAWTYSNPK